MHVLIRGKVSSSIEDLEQLHVDYPWLPSAQQIRPTPEALTRKHSTIDMISSDWQSFTDYILHTVFQAEVYMNANNKYEASHDDVSHEMRFEQNMFPYQVTGSHYVLWFGTAAQCCSDEEISATIDKLLSQRYPQQSYDFAWYINPKMTVPEFFHVQVFFTLPA